MFIIACQLAGALAFAGATIILGIHIRKHPDRLTAKQVLRINRVSFRACFLAPGLLGVIHPGLLGYDALVGLSSAPSNLIAISVGFVMISAGGLIIVQALRDGTSSHRSLGPHTRYRPRHSGLHKRVRHPFAVGGYLACAGIALVSGSTALLLLILAILLPVHVLNLLFLQERALAAIYGSSYEAYRRRVPFLLPVGERSPK